MPLAEVQRRLGRHLSTEYFYLKDQTHYDWRYTVGRQRADAKIFSVIFDRQMRVVATMSTDDPRTRAKGGYIPWR